jgi:transposase
LADESNCSTVNLYFQDESRFGLKTHLGSCICAKGVQALVPYQHKFQNTYLYGAYSPIDGQSYTWEMSSVNKEIFIRYLNSFAAHKAEEFKIIVIDNAAFHSTLDVQLPSNIYLLKIPPYTPELNPCEQIWREIKKRFKRQVFKTLEKLKEWLYLTVNQLKPETIKSITSNHHYRDAFFATFNR